MDDNIDVTNLVLLEKISSLENQILDLKKTIKKLEPADARLKSIIASSDIGILDYIIPIAYHLYQCPELAMILGYQDDINFIFNKDLDWFIGNIHKDDYEKIKPQFDKMISGDSDKERFSFRFLHRNGSWIYLRMFCIVKERDNHNDINRLMAVVQDVSAQQKIDSALMSSERRYHGIFENSPLSLWEEDWSEVQDYLNKLKENGVTDLKEYFTEHHQALSKCVSMVKILDVNKRTLEIHKAKSKDELLGNLNTVFNDITTHNFIAELEAIARGDKIYEAENIHRTLDGEQLHIKMRLSVIPGYEKDLSKVIVSMMNITEKKNIETEKNAARAELERINLSHRELENTIAICLSCNKVRQDKNFNDRIFAYLKKHPEAEFMHYVCTNCKDKLVKQNSRT